MSAETLVNEIVSSRLSDNGNTQTESVTQEEYLVWAVNHPSLPSDFLRLLMQVTFLSLSYCDILRGLWDVLLCSSACNDVRMALPDLLYYIQKTASVQSFLTL